MSFSDAPCWEKAQVYQSHTVPEVNLGSAGPSVSEKPHEFLYGTQGAEDWGFVGARRFVIIPGSGHFCIFAT